MIGFAATALLPARAGEVLRPWLLARKEGLSATAAFATIILERVLDTVMVLLLFGLFLLLTDPEIAQGDGWRSAASSSAAWSAAVVSRGALVVMFVLAGHPATIARIGAAREPVAAGAAGARAATRFVQHLRGRAWRIVRQPGRLAVAMVLSVPLWLRLRPGSGWCRTPSTSTCRSPARS